MSRKDVPDWVIARVCAAKCVHEERALTWAMLDHFLSKVTGEPEQVVYRALERAVTHGLIEYGVSIRTAWNTEKGRELAAQPQESDSLRDAVRKAAGPCVRCGLAYAMSTVVYRDAADEYRLYWFCCGAELVLTATAHAVNNHACARRLGEHVREEFSRLWLPATAGGDRP